MTIALSRKSDCLFVNSKPLILPTWHSRNGSKGQEVLDYRDRHYINGRLNEVENKKWRKYKMLAGKLRIMCPGFQTECTLVVMKWNGRVSHKYKRNGKRIGLTIEDTAYMQTMVLRQTMNARGRHPLDWQPILKHIVTSSSLTQHQVY